MDHDEAVAFVRMHQYRDVDQIAAEMEISRAEAVKLAAAAFVASEDDDPTDTF